MKTKTKKVYQEIKILSEFCDFFFSSATNFVKKAIAEEKKKKILNRCVFQLTKLLNFENDLQKARTLPNINMNWN